MSEKVVCIMCPVGCEVRAEVEDGEIVEIEGYGCEDGREYAEQELASPKRTVMSVVNCVGGDFPTVSVKTTKQIAREDIEAVMEVLSDVEVKPPVEMGDVVVKDVFGLDVDVVATRTVEKVQD